MRKLIALMGLLVLFIYVYAEITTPVNLILTDNPIRFDPDQGVFVCPEGLLHIAYQELAENQVFVKYAKSNLIHDDFIIVNIAVVEIDSLFKNPVIIYDAEQKINVVYHAENSSHYIFLNIARIETDRISFHYFAKISKTDYTISYVNNQFQVNYLEPFQRQLSEYLLFTDTEKSILSDEPGNPAAIISYDGSDILKGAIHSNSDIYIRNSIQEAGHTVNPSAPGYPLITGFVTTTGNIIDEDNNPFPENSVFIAGFQENSEHIDYFIDSLVYYSITPFGLDYAPYYNIYMLDINNNSVEMRTGHVYTRVESLTVYSEYPDPLNPGIAVGDSIGFNTVAIQDTLWTPQGILSLNNRAVYLPGDVWVKGQVAGNMAIIAKGDIYIIGDLTYASTPVGQNPYDEENGHINSTDFLTLISEKNIYIKYKYKCPQSGQTIFSPNAEGADGNIYLYGAFAALGEADSELGEDAYKTEGVFSFEYQHPHGATPNFTRVNEETGASEFFDYIDLHKYQFPPQSHDSDGPYWTRWPGRLHPEDSDIISYGYPQQNMPAPYYYSVLDYPFYNPVYPEKVPNDIDNPNPATDIVYNRGTINLYGSIFQKRKGFLKRSGTVDEKNIDMSDLFWDIENGIYGPSHPTTGYKRNFVHDERFKYVNLINFPYQGTDYFMIKNNKYYSLEQEILNSDNTHFSNNVVITSDSNQIFGVGLDYDNSGLRFFYTDNDSYLFRKHFLENIDKLINAKLIDGFGFVLFTKTDGMMSLIKYDIENNLYNVYDILQKTELDLNSTFMTEFDNKFVIIINTQTEIRFYEFLNDTIVLSNSLPAVSTIYNEPVTGLSAYKTLSDSLLFILSTEYGNGKKLYFAKGKVSDFTSEQNDLMPQKKQFLLSCYPNPFNPDTTIEFYLPQNDFVNIDIYNIKGQKVNSLIRNQYLETGNHRVSFVGKDNFNKDLASGIYFVKFKSENHRFVSKVLLIK